MRRFEFDTVSSTMDEARRISSLVEPPFLVLAKAQTEGRGRQGKPWLSCEGAYLGTFCLPRKRLELSGFSLAIGVGIVQSLEIKDAKLKWPNDIFINGRKCCGILIEVQDNIVLVGIGVNLDHAPDGFSALCGFTHEYVSSILERVIPEISELFMVEGFAPWKDSFNELDFLKGKSLRAGEVAGIGTGVDETGAYLIDVTKRIIAGSIEFDVSS
jgi:BirA family biotin operon repressor/biotin-[acetyl-CoA-carboxylase] ligase